MGDCSPRRRDTSRAVSRHWSALCLALLGLLLCHLGGAGSRQHPHPQGALSPAALHRLGDFIESLRECRRVPGLQLAIVDLREDSGARVTTQGYGLADIERGVPVTPHTRFCVASLTKALTAILLGKLLRRSR